jgi:hypothetical protein
MVTYRMVDLGQPPSPLVSRPEMSKHDLPAAISKLLNTTTKLRPREGPMLAWTTEFNDLLTANSLSDYIHFSPPERSTLYAMYPNEGAAENAYTAKMIEYQHFNELLYYLLKKCIDLSGVNERMDTTHITSHFTLGDLRDGRGLYHWAMSFKSQKDPSVQAALIRNVYSDAKIPVTITGDDLAKKLTDLAADWVGITDHEKDKPPSFYEALLTASCQLSQRPPN